MSAEGATLRVILVGRTGIDAALRKDPHIELYRVDSPLEAVCELAIPAADGGARAVVVVSAEVEAELRDGAAGDHAAEFMRGLRIADPGVVVLGVARNGEAVLTPFDGALSPDLTPERVRSEFRAMASPRAGAQEPPRIVRGQVSTPRAAANADAINADAEEFEDWSAALGSPALGAPTAAPPASPASASGGPPPVRPAAAISPSISTAPSTSTTDLPLVAALVRGQDILPPALGIIRARAGDATIEFLPHSSNAPPDTRRPADQAVAWEGAVLGHLRSQRAESPPLAEHAAWLAAWLRLRDQQSQLRAAAFTDSLTGAYNRRYFDKFLATAIEQARENRRHLTLMVFDIDDFKQYNDRFGHDAGDDILCETVKMMRSVIRPTDRVCRIGGDEFAVIFYEPQGPRVEGSRHPASVFAIAQRFQQQVHEHKFPRLAGVDAGTLTISGGLATFPWDGATVEQLVAKADALALQSKRQGKNAITFGPRGEV